MRSKTWRRAAGSSARKNSAPVRSAIRFSRSGLTLTSAITVSVTIAPVKGSRARTGIGTRPPRPTRIV